MRNKLGAFLVVVIAIFVVLPVFAVRFGELDYDHPYVGLLIFDDESGPAWRCTGTLLTPTVMITAGHCTFGATAARVWFETDVESGIPGNGYPFGGGTSIEATSIATHPDYNDTAFFLHDLGIVILSQAVNTGNAVLPQVNFLDGLATKRGLQEQLFNRDSLLECKNYVNKIHLDDKLAKYIVEIILATRSPGDYGLENLQNLISVGTSPRATIGIARASKAKAFLDGRAFVTAEDIKAVAIPVLRHRLILSFEAEAESVSPDEIVTELMAKVEVS
jgi:hypothetical protein